MFVIIHADAWMLAKKELPDTKAEVSCLRLYHVYYPGGGIDNLDETDVMNLVGEEAFKRTF